MSCTTGSSLLLTDAFTDNFGFIREDFNKNKLVLGTLSLKGGGRGLGKSKLVPKSLILICSHLTHVYYRSKIKISVPNSNLFLKSSLSHF